MSKDNSELDARIAAAKAKRDKGEVAEKSRRSGDAGRVISELVGGLVVGCGGGWLLDEFFGTLPFFFLICSVLGIGASLKTVARMGERAAEAAEKEANED